MILKITTLDQSPEELLDQLENKDLYVPFLAKMSKPRQREWLAVRVLLKEILGEEKQILYTAYGKPYLADQSCHIGISHTKGYAVIALDKEYPVAIDVERLSPRIEKIRSRFLSETEEKNLSGKQQVIHALLCWSAKETLFKYMDENDIEFKSQLHIHPFEPVIREWGEFTASETRTAKCRSFIIRYLVTGEYVLTVLSNTLI